MTKLTNKFPRLSATVIEPNVEMITRYQEGLRDSEKAHLTSIDYEWRNQTFQEYMKATEATKQKYHFISTIHAIYYMGESDEVIKCLYDLLLPGGVMLIALFTGTIT